MNTDARTDDGIDNEHGILDCRCGAKFYYTGWTAPETIGWWEQHDDGPEHGIGVVQVTKDCSCGRGDHPQGCAPPGHWID